MPEKAWGADLGYEHHLGRTGVVGVNVFYRKIDDLIELVNTGEEGVGRRGHLRLPAAERRRRRGLRHRVRPFERSRLPRPARHRHFRQPLAARQLGRRRVRRAPVQRPVGHRLQLRLHPEPAPARRGVRRDVPQAGLGLRPRAAARKLRPRPTGPTSRCSSRSASATASRSARWAPTCSTARSAKPFNKFDTFEDQVDRDFDEYELESERAGPVFQLVGRYAF